MMKQIVRAAMVCCFFDPAGDLHRCAGQLRLQERRGEGPSLAGRHKHKEQQRAANSEDPKVPAPESKGGPKAKGAGCMIHVDNETPWIVGIYLGGEYEGTVGRWGDGYMPITSGYAVLYGRAEFDDGSVRTFGPREFRCGSGSYTWTLGQ